MRTGWLCGIYPLFVGSISRPDHQYILSWLTSFLYQFRRPDYEVDLISRHFRKRSGFSLGPIESEWITRLCAVMVV